MRVKACLECGIQLTGGPAQKRCPPCAKARRVEQDRDRRRPKMEPRLDRANCEPCTSCGKAVWRGRSSSPEIVCQDCRRAGVGRADRPRRMCVVCGSEFVIPQSRRKGVQEACPGECGRKLRALRRWPPGVTISRNGRRCEVCDRTYQASHASQRTCGRECGVTLKLANAATRQAMLPPRPPRLPRPPRPQIPCAWCSEPFLLRSSRSRFCSVTCENREYAHRERGGPGPEGRPCLLCDRLGWWRRYCTSCAEIASIEAARLGKRRAKRARRARERAAPSDGYTLAEVAIEDDYICGLCGDWVDMNLEVPHPEAPTIDHIVPLVRGGTDYRENLQLAHFLCNSRKGDRTADPHRGGLRCSVDVVHETPATWSDQRMHVLDDLGTCWCRPTNEVVDGRLVITHQGP